MPPLNRTNPLNAIQLGQLFPLLLSLRFLPDSVLRAQSTLFFIAKLVIIVPSQLEVLLSLVRSRGTRALLHASRSPIPRLSNNKSQDHKFNDCERNAQREGQPAVLAQPEPRHDIQHAKREDHAPKPDVHGAHPGLATIAGHEDDVVAPA